MEVWKEKWRKRGGRKGGGLVGSKEGDDRGLGNIFYYGLVGIVKREMTEGWGIYFIMVYYSLENQ